MIIEYTAAQAAAIVAKWNDLANDDNQLTANQAHLIFHDNSDAEMEEQGCTSIEVHGRQSRDGNPATLYITEEVISFE